MTSLHIQNPEHAIRYADPDGGLVSIGGQALLGGSSNAPKFGTLIPNRIFVGGIPSNTTEQELKTFFSGFGQIKDVKIINDRLGVAKGSYGFVTFENQDMAEKIIKNESETLIFKDRKLNIGHAIRKQQVFPRPADVPATLFFAGGAIPCGFQNGMTVFPLASQDYSVLAQPGSPYQSMMLQQGNGAVYLSQQGAPAAIQYSGLQSQLGSSNALVALQQQQQYQQAALNSTLSANTMGLGSSSTNSAASIIAAAAALAASGQWPNAISNPSSPTNQQMPISSQQFTNGQNVSQNSSMYNNLESQPQLAAFAAAVAAQQQIAAAWGWPTQQQNGVSSQSSNGALTSSSVESSASTSQAVSNSTNTSNGISGSMVQQQSPMPASLGPSAYLYSPITGTGHEFMLIQQANSSYNPNTTSDYSTDHSAQSPSFLESLEPNNFQSEAMHNSRQSQSCGPCQNIGASFEFACMPPYTNISPMFDRIVNSSPATVSSILGIQQSNQKFHQQISPTSGIISLPSGQVAPQLISIQNPQQHKLYAAIPNSALNTNPANQNCQFAAPTIYGQPQPIILDVFPGGLPLSQMKQGTTIDENFNCQLVENAANSIKSNSQIIGCGGVANFGVCLPQQTNGNRSNSPVKSTPICISSNQGVNNRNIFENMNNSLTSHTI